MWSRPESDEALVMRLLPGTNPDQGERARAWSEWQASIGETSVLKFIRANNTTNEPDEDILQDALLTAYLEVERGRYEQRAGVPFTAYVKGIARNKIREARRRERYWTGLEEIPYKPADTSQRQLEVSIEVREQVEALCHGLSRLPSHRRQVLERYIRGKTTVQIAAELAMTEEVVRQHKCRGLRSLRQMNVFQ
jgi:RNA polymerase sigma factor (sigma-70 family)